MIPARLKSIVYSRKIRKALKNKARDKQENTGKVALIIDAETFSVNRNLLEIFNLLELKKKDFSAVICGNVDVGIDTTGFEILNDKDISISGEFRSEGISNFLLSSYDLVVCYFSSKNQAGLLLASECKADIKIGNAPYVFGIFDVEINTLELESFQQEVLKYYRILKNKN